MSSHEDGYLDIEVEVLDDADVREAIASALALAGAVGRSYKSKMGSAASLPKSLNEPGSSCRPSSNCR